MPLGKYRKAPGETKRYSTDYNNWLDEGEQLVDIQFAVTPVSIPPLVAGTPAIEPDGRGVQWFASGGVDDITYEVLLTATTTGGQIKEDVVVFSIQEPQ